MAVDPNVRWIGLSDDGRPLTITALRSIDLQSARWALGGSAVPHRIFRKSFIYVRGLYSRHGRFYPPYGPLPDVNWRQLAVNFAD